MKANAFMIVSMCLGILSVISCPLFFISIPAAAISIILAILSKGKNLRMDFMAKSGIVSSALGMVLCTAITTMMVMLLLLSPEYLRQLNETSQAIYGQSLDTMMESTYGFTLEQLQEQVQKQFSAKQ